MERIKNVANYLCNEYYKISKHKIDELKLHKLLYFAQRENIAITGEPMFDEALEGWRHGPVSVEVRNAFDDGEIIGETGNVSSQCAYILDNIIAQYGGYESWALRQMSHNEVSWLNSRKGLGPKEMGNVRLTIEDITIDAQKVRPYDSVWDMYYDEFEDYEELQ